VRRHIVGLAVLSAILAITLFGIPLAILVGRADRNDEQVELVRLADQVAIAVAADVVHGHRVALELPPVSDHNAVGVYDEHGNRIAGAGPTSGDAAVRTAIRGSQASADSAGRMIVAVPITDNQRVVSVVRADTTHTEAYRRTAEAWLVMLALALGALVVTWLIARWQARRLARPLERLSDAAQRLGNGDFSARAARSGIPEADSVGAALNTTAGRLGEALTRERAFSANASHQLRTPLTGLRLELEAASDSSAAEMRSAIDGALTSVDRLDQTIDDLLMLRRDTWRPAEPVDVATLLGELGDLWADLLRRQGRTLRLCIAPGTRVDAAPAAVRQIVTVLLDNATLHGSGTVTVTTRVLDGAVAIDIADEGAPISDPAENLFAPRTHPSAEHGIGLSLARALAEAERGRLMLSSPDPPTFSALLPASGPSAAGNV
jgi:signal transduction histidine kinase